jgi:hypothetical protein
MYMWKENDKSLYWIRCLLELHRWSRRGHKCLTSLHMSLVNRSIHLKKPSPSWVWYVLGCIPQEISLTSFSSSSLTPIHIWSHIVSHMGWLRRGPAVHQPPCSATSIFQLTFQGLFYSKNLRSFSYLYRNPPKIKIWNEHLLDKLCSPSLFLTHVPKIFVVCFFAEFESQFKM